MAARTVASRSGVGVSVHALAVWVSRSANIASAVLSRSGVSLGTGVFVADGVALGIGLAVSLGAGVESICFSGTSVGGGVLVGVPRITITGAVLVKVAVSPAP